MQPAEPQFCPVMLSIIILLFYFYSSFFLAQLLKEGFYGWKKVKFMVQKVRR